MPETIVTLISGEQTDSNADFTDALPENVIPVQKKLLDVDGYMVSHPGLTLHATGEGKDRGGLWNRYYQAHARVSGSRFILVQEDGATIDLGKISGNDQCSFADSFISQAVVGDHKMWIYDGTLTRVTDSDLGSPIDITWIDGYYFLTDGDYLYHTDLNNESSIDPLKYATAEFSPDKTLAVDTTIDNQVIVFGRYSIEYFQNKALDNFAFERISGKSLRVGTVGTHAYTQIEGVYYLLGSPVNESISVYAVNSGQYKSIATREIEKIISKYTESQLADVIVETRTEQRDVLLIVHLPDETLVYNVGIAQNYGLNVAWSAIKTGVEQTSSAWRGVNGVYNPNIPAWVYGDKINSNIGLLDHTTAEQYGEQQEISLYTPLLRLEAQSINSVGIDTVTGDGDTTASVSVTYDGKNYSQEWFNLYGIKDNYATRFILRRLGYCRHYIGFKIRCVTSGNVNFIGMRVNHG